MVTCLVSQYHTARCSLFGNCEGRGRLSISNLLADTVFQGTVLHSYPYFIANVEGDKPTLNYSCPEIQFFCCLHKHVGKNYFFA